MGLGLYGLIRVQGLGFRVQGLGFRVSGSGKFRISARVVKGVLVRVDCNYVNW